MTATAKRMRAARRKRLGRLILLARLTAASASSMRLPWSLVPLTPLPSPNGVNPPGVDSGFFPLGLVIGVRSGLSGGASLLQVFGGRKRRLSAVTIGVFAYFAGQMLP